jgi:hypothetical protein
MPFRSEETMDCRACSFGCITITATTSAVGRAFAALLLRAVEVIE